MASTGDHALTKIHIQAGNMSFDIEVDKEERQKLTTDPVYRASYIRQLLIFARPEGNTTAEPDVPVLQLPQINLAEADPNEGTSCIQNVQKTCNKGSSSFVWTHASVMLLIRTRLDMDLDFQRPKCKKLKLWEKISSLLNGHGYEVQGHQCDMKWRNLTTTYRKIKDRKTGEGTITWEYFHVMDEVLGTKASTNPSMELLTSSIPQSPESISTRCSSTSEDTIDNEEAFLGNQSIKRNSENENTGSRPKKKQKTLSTEEPQWLSKIMEKIDEQNNETNQKENERWEKLMAKMDAQQASEDKKVLALTNLTSVLEKFLQK